MSLSSMEKISLFECDGPLIYIGSLIRSLNSKDCCDKVVLVSIYPCHISVVAQELQMSIFDLLNVARKGRHGLGLDRPRPILAGPDRAGPDRAGPAHGPKR